VVTSSVMVAVFTQAETRCIKTLKVYRIIVINNLYAYFCKCWNFAKDSLCSYGLVVGVQD
jgi:hypothetical protein